MAVLEITAVGMRPFSRCQSADLYQLLMKTANVIELIQKLNIKK